MILEIKEILHLGSIHIYHTTLTKQMYINSHRYDFHDGNWNERITTHHSNLYNVPYADFSVDSSVRHAMEVGVPSHKVI